ncbi:hypothetical protein GCM10028805_65650 [Spirosoma harenae]
MSVLFDIRGNLQANSLVILSQLEIEQFFVNSFDSTSTRHVLFEEYKRYTVDLRRILERPFYQWINGSFTSNTHSPNDIDLISFIDHETYQIKEQEIDERFSKWRVKQYYTGLDAFTVWTYPNEHNYSTLFLADFAYWQDWFGHTRYNRNRKRFAKGFISINID